MSPERFPEQCHTVKKILFTHEGEMLLGISEMNKKHAGTWLFFSNEKGVIPLSFNLGTVFFEGGMSLLH